jgi:hypothetical protein
MHRRLGFWLSLAILAAGGVVLWIVWPRPELAATATRAPALHDRANSPSIAKPIAPAPPPEPPIDRAAIRRKAWALAGPLLNEADLQAQKEIDRATSRISKFFIDRKAGSRPFAEDILSLGGKWKFIRSKLPNAAADEHFRYLTDRFAEHLFSADDLRQEVDATLAAYAANVQAIENRLLVRLRADVAASDPASGRVFPELASDNEFRLSYEALVSKVARDATKTAAVDLGVFITWQLIGQGVMQEVATKVLSAVAARMAASAGITTTGAASGVATFGLGVVAGIVLDIAFDWIMRQTGHDGVTRVAAIVSTAVQESGDAVVNGFPEAVREYDTLRRLEREHSSLEIRKQSRETADSIQASGNLGLRRELMRVHNMRRSLRDAALERLLLGSDAAAGSSAAAGPVK